MNRAYSTFTIKAVTEETRTITGMATSPQVDRVGDVVESLGVTFKNPMPLLMHHEHDEPVGLAEFGTPTAKGVPFTATFPTIAEDGDLKDRIEEAWQSVKAGLIRAVSIGFRSLEEENIAGSWGTRYIKSEVFELSLVTIPCNTDATIQTIKSFDHGAPAASGKSAHTVVRLGKPAGASATVVKQIPKVPKPQEGNMKISEQIKSFQDALTQKSARQLELMTAAEGRTLDAAESEEFDTLSDELAATEVHIKRLEQMSKSNVSKATEVTDESGMRKPLGHISVKATHQVAKGTAFTRYVIAQCRAKGNLVQAAEIAKQWSDTTPEVAEVLKAAVAAGTTTDAAWAAPLVPYQNMTSEFIELLRPQVLTSRLTQLRAVPFNVRFPGQTSGSTVSWVGETSPKPVSALGFQDITLRFNKLAGIVVISEELARLSTPSAEAIIQGDLTAQIAQFTDDSFINPAYAAITDVRPASVTNGVTPIVATGIDAESLREDIRAAYSSFIQANMSVTGATWIMTSTMAMSIGMMMNPLGQPEFPGIGAEGGTLAGLPVLTSENVPHDSSGSILVLVKQSEILLADEGGVTVDVSREASVQMNSTPDNPTTATSVLTSLWQNNLIGVRCERLITWKKRRPQAVAYISAANYGS
jgi:HK97 family phage major capsid protein